VDNNGTRVFDLNKWMVNRADELEKETKKLEAEQLARSRALPISGT
jgi:hypothetical protein